MAQPRKNLDSAAQRVKAGESIAAVAKSLGVSRQALQQALKRREGWAAE